STVINTMRAIPAGTRRIGNACSNTYSSPRASLTRSITNSIPLNTARNRNAMAYSGTQLKCAPPRNIESASATDGARKKIHDTHTRWKTTIRDIHAGTDVKGDESGASARSPAKR